jgi:hypothetical protein
MIEQYKILSLKEQVIKNIERFNSPEYQVLLLEAEEEANLQKYYEIKDAILLRSKDGHNVFNFEYLEEYTIEKLKQEGFYIRKDDYYIYPYTVYLNEPVIVKKRSLLSKILESVISISLIVGFIYLVIKSQH